MKTGDACKATMVALLNVMKSDTRWSTSPFNAGLNRLYTVLNGGGDSTKAEDNLFVDAWKHYINTNSNY